MSKARRRDTKPELDVRQRLHAQGLRYRVELPVPGLARRTIDIAFTKKRVAVFIDGCFWHSCPEHGTMPRANSEWWATKLRRNAARDAETAEVLSAAGWRVLRFWEHADPESIVAQIRSVLIRPIEPAFAGDFDDGGLDAMSAHGKVRPWTRTDGLDAR